MSVTTATVPRILEMDSRILNHTFVCVLCMRLAGTSGWHLSTSDLALLIFGNRCTDYLPVVLGAGSDILVFGMIQPC